MRSSSRKWRYTSEYYWRVHLGVGRFSITDTSLPLPRARERDIFFCSNTIAVPLAVDSELTIELLRTA